MEQKPAPVSPKELLTRQLADWKQLIQALYEQDNPSEADLRYCATQVRRLNDELAKLD